MGFSFRDVLDPAGGFSGEGSFESLTNPAGRIADKYSDSWVGQLADPMDLFGHRADRTRDSIKEILINSAKEGIEQMEKQEAYLREQYQPYYESGLAGAKDLRTMAEGGELEGYQPSRIFEYQKEKGFEKLAEQYEGEQEQMAVSGLLHSSAMNEVTEDSQERKAAFIGDLAAEEADRMYSGQLQRTQIGAGSADAISAAGTATSGKIGGLYANLGQGLNTNEQAHGQNREAAWSTASNTLMNLDGYMTHREVK